MSDNKEEPIIKEKANRKKKEKKNYRAFSRKYLEKKYMYMSTDED